MKQGKGLIKGKFVSGTILDVHTIQCRVILELMGTGRSEFAFNVHRARNVP